LQISITDSWNYYYWGQKFELGRDSTIGKALCLVVKCGGIIIQTERDKGRCYEWH